MYYQGGPIAALIYPATEARIWTFEKYSYYLHHILLLFTPIYLYQVYSGKRQQQYNNNKYNEEEGPSTRKKYEILRNPFNMSWLLHAYGVWMIGNVIIHWISYFTTANINVTLCPQVGVPSYGENYRLHSLYWHMLFHIISAVLYSALTRFASYVYKYVEILDVNNANSTNVNNNCQTSHNKVAKEE